MHDIVGPRLEALCRLYIGTVFYLYFDYDDETEKFPHRDSTLKGLTDTDGLIFHRGNHFASKWSGQKSDKEIKGKLNV